VTDLLAEQAQYYRDRAPEYDDWWFRRRKFDHGIGSNASWFADVTELERVLEGFEPGGNVLELACGTGLWTRRLARHADRLTAVDASAEVIELNRRRVGSADVEYVQADLFSWRPEHLFDVCFFGFWLSHVPEERFDAFWQTVRAALRPGGRALFFDSARPGPGGASDGTGTTTRQLEDGREYRIVKRFHEPRALERRLAVLGWDASVGTTREFFLYGEAITA
jgi:demethylmenaquinone methyltransferase/2-methoxy-6-polyprenyl-1,4-benzoquinol methylase